MGADCKSVKPKDPRQVKIKLKASFESAILSLIRNLDIEIESVKDTLNVAKVKAYELKSQNLDDAKNYILQFLVSLNNYDVKTCLKQEIELVFNSIEYIVEVDTFPEKLIQNIYNVVYAQSKFENIKELVTLNKLFNQKYGYDFCDKVHKDKHLVNPKILNYNSSPVFSDLEIKNKLNEICIGFSGRTSSSIGGANLRASLNRPEGSYAFDKIGTTVSFGVPGLVNTSPKNDHHFQDNQNQRVEFISNNGVNNNENNNANNNINNNQRNQIFQINPNYSQNNLNYQNSQNYQVNQSNQVFPSNNINTSHQENNQANPSNQINQLNNLKRNPIQENNISHYSGNFAFNNSGGMQANNNPNANVNSNYSDNVQVTIQENHNMGSSQQFKGSLHAEGNLMTFKANNSISEVNPKDMKHSEQVVDNHNPLYQPLLSSEKEHRNDFEQIEDNKYNDHHNIEIRKITESIVLDDVNIENQDKTGFTGSVYMLKSEIVSPEMINRMKNNKQIN